MTLAHLLTTPHDFELVKDLFSCLFRPILGLLMNQDLANTYLNLNTNLTPWVCLADLIIISTSSSNGILHSRWKCMDRQHVFSCKNKNFTSRSEPNKTLFWGNDPEFILVMKNSLQRHIIYLSLKSFLKSYVFRDRQWNWQLKFVSFCLQG